MDEVPFSPVDVVSVADEETTAEGEETSTVPVLEDARATAVATIEAGEVPLVAVVVSAGRITTSLLATVMPASISRQTGSCWKRLISTVLPSST